MKPLWITAVALGVMGISSAQTASTPPADTTIATISFNTAVLQTTEAQRSLAALQTKYAPRQSHLEALNTEIEGLQKQAANDATKVSSLNAKEKQLQREAEDLRTEMQTASQEAYGVVAQKLYGYLQEFSSQHGYKAVIERGSDEAPVIWYAAANLDITKAVIDGYNARNANTTSVPNVAKPSAPPQKHL